MMKNSHLAILLAAAFLSAPASAEPIKIGVGPIGSPGPTVGPSLQSPGVGNPGVSITPNLSGVTLTPTIGGTTPVPKVQEGNQQEGGGEPPRLAVGPVYFALACAVLNSETCELAFEGYENWEDVSTSVRLADWAKALEEERRLFVTVPFPVLSTQQVLQALVRFETRSILEMETKIRADIVRIAPMEWESPEAKEAKRLEMERHNREIDRLKAEATAQAESEASSHWVPDGESRFEFKAGRAYRDLTNHMNVNTSWN
ncbi:MAG: hypothetical protein WC969_11170 [Elusimicrobiota bacterium]|jgi:hypothetical protein